jgi:hypothetical protein
VRDQTLSTEKMDFELKYCNAYTQQILVEMAFLHEQVARLENKVAGLYHKLEEKGVV